MIDIVNINANAQVAFGLALISFLLVLILFHKDSQVKNK